MTTKTITIMEDAYEMLNRLKKGDESFSEVIRGLAKSRRGSVEAVLECAGLWKDMPDKDIEEMKMELNILELKEFVGLLIWIIKKDMKI